MTTKRSKITDQFNVDLPMTATLDYIRHKYGKDIAQEINAIYLENGRRYSRACQLRLLQRLINTRTNRHPSFNRYSDDARYKRYQYCIDHAQEFIDGTITLKSLKEEDDKR